MGWHYDWRFFNGALNYEKPDWNQQELTHRTNIILDRLLRNWSKFAMEKGSLPGLCMVHYCLGIGTDYCSHMIMILISKCLLMN